MRLTKIHGKNSLVFDARELKNFPFEGKPILNIEDTVYISGTAYAKTEAAFQAAEQAAVANRYSDSITKPEDRHKGVFFSLEEVHAAQCGSCSEIISPKGVRCHNHKCEHCGEPTFLEYTRDGGISLQFMKNGENVGRSPLTFRIFGYREHDGKPDELLLFPKPILGDYAPPRHEKRGWNGIRQRFFAVDDAEEAQMILEEAKDLYTKEVVDDPLSGEKIEILVIKNHTPGRINDLSVFNTYDVAGQIHNHRTVKSYNGKIYDEWATLPVPDQFSLSRKYIGKDRHSLSEPTIHEIILSAAGQVSRTDYYHQDGSAAFSDLVYKRMTDFVEHFVDADMEKWSVFLFNAPQDGPGFIRSLANWCASESDGQKRNVRCEPNMWNAISGMGKILSGQPLTYPESVAMVEGAETDDANDLAGKLKSSFEAQQTGKRKAFKRRLDRWIENPEAAPENNAEKPQNPENGPS